MFEKEAKKHKEEFITAYISVGGGLKAADMIGIQKEQSYKEGAEFGYIKANEQLLKAKEIIKDYLTIAKGAHITVCGVSEENRSIYALKLNEEAEQFISEVENQLNHQ